MKKINVSNISRIQAKILRSCDSVLWRYNTSGLHELALNWAFLAKIWRPDTFFVNGKQSFLHKITVPNRSIFMEYFCSPVYTFQCCTLNNSFSIEPRCPGWLKKLCNYIKIYSWRLFRMCCSGFVKPGKILLVKHLFWNKIFRFVLFFSSLIREKFSDYHWQRKFLWLSLSEKRSQTIIVRERFSDYNCQREVLRLSLSESMYKNCQRKVFRLSLSDKITQTIIVTERYSDYHCQRKVLRLSLSEKGTQTIIVRERFSVYHCQGKVLWLSLSEKSTLIIIVRERFPD